MVLVQSEKFIYFKSYSWISASTRAVYEKKLRKLLQSDGNEGLNEAETAVLYSDSDEEGEENGDLEDEKESGGTRII